LSALGVLKNVEECSHVDEWIVLPGKLEHGCTNLVAVPGLTCISHTLISMKRCIQSVYAVHQLPVTLRGAQVVSPGRAKPWSVGNFVQK